MKTSISLRYLTVACGLGFASLACAESYITIYNQDFGVVRESREFSLKKGENEVRVTDVTAHLEPESIIVRDMRNPDSLQVLEQNYESDPLSEGAMLKKMEGKTMSFQVIVPQTGEKKIIQGKILRSGYVPSGIRNYGNPYSAQPTPSQPIVEVDGKIMFGLPGMPLFDALDSNAFLKPTLLWKLLAKEAGTRDVEFAYLTGGMHWEADYNLVMPEKGDNVDLVGWVTLQNTSGMEFENAHINLMAGDVARAQTRGRLEVASMCAKAMACDEVAAPPVTEKTFDEYHLYTLQRPTTLRDREVKQVEFARAANVPARRIYVYDGFQQNPGEVWDYEAIRQNPGYGTNSTPKIWSMLEFMNSEKSGLGLPLPMGKMKVYRKDDTGHQEFVGEDRIDHTPKDETVRLYLGNAFDLTGERKQLNYQVNTKARTADEEFQIKVRNHKKEAVEVRVVEHMYRWLQWDIVKNSHDFKKIDAKTMEFRVKVPADGETVINYQVHYSW